MLISELFYSLQGEGSLLGVPSVFIRTSGCNLRCRWCDTPYASWKAEGSAMTVSQVMDYVLQHPQCGHVVVTGGEPMVAKEMPELLAALHEAGKHITVETAGTIPPGGIPCDLASLSPKLAHSTPLPGEVHPYVLQQQKGLPAGDAHVARHEALRWQPEVLRQWLEGPWQVQLKFVISEEKDVLEVVQCLAELAPDFPREKVLLMPEGISHEALASRQMILVEACKRYGFRYSPRLHIDLFGNKRGT